MNCPKCGKTMGLGHLVGFHPKRAVYWMPYGVKGAPHGLPNEKQKLEAKGGHCIRNIGSAFFDPKLTAWYCPDCRCGIFEAETSENE